MTNALATPNIRVMDNELHPDSRIIDDLGGTFEVARMFKIKPPSVSGWRKNGIPDARRMYLEVVRPDVLAREQEAA